MLHKLKKLEYIDAIRGIAIIMVVMHHTNQQGGVEMPHGFSVLFSLGSRGVQLFFIASAFTLFRSYKRRCSVETTPMSNFFIRRYFRIAPIYYLAIVYYIFHQSFNIPYWFGVQPYISDYNIISNLFFLHGFSPNWTNTLVPGGWSIAVEMMFYVIFPFLFSRILNINDAFKFLIVSLVFKLVLQEILFHNQLLESDFLWMEYLFYYFPSQLPIFALGIIMFFLIEDFKNFYQVSKALKLAALILVPIQIGSSLNFLYVNHIIFSMGFVVFGVLLSRGYFKFLGTPIIRYIGKISYSMYIFHFIVISWFKEFNIIDFTDNALINYFIRLILIMSVSVFVSSISYKLIEMPFQKMGKKIISQMDLFRNKLALKN